MAQAPLLTATLIVLIGAVHCAGGEAQTPPASELKVAHHARSLQPGEVVLLTVVSPKPLQSASGTVFRKSFPLFQNREAGVWQGLIGIDPESAAGSYKIRLRCTCADGTTLEGGDVLEVRSKVFPTRRLTVEERYVTPPAETEERIRLESQRVEEIFSLLNPRRIWNGPFVAPVHAPPTSSFGRRTILNGKPRSPHWGTDFTADAGAPVMAPNSGRIVLAADLYFSGNTIIIDHGLGLYSFLAHLSQIGVHEGDEVRAGSQVGRVGATGRATGPHLHWTVRLNSVRVDPLSLIAALAKPPP
jgi:murein DD-endopeptidase MepM/ murein hydrolase activator NlpD